MKEYRTFKLEIRSLDDSTGKIEGYASVFNNAFPIWDHMETVSPGAFKRTLKNNGGRVPILFNHSSGEWIGNASSGIEDDHGLLVTGDLLTSAVQRAREVYALAKDAMEKKMKVGLSIGFEVIKDLRATIDGIDTRILKEIALWEWSITQWPANPDAQLTDIRSLDELAITLSKLTTDERQKIMALVASEASTRQPALQSSTPDNRLADALDKFFKACRGA